jgi:hypothetical protein
MSHICRQLLGDLIMVRQLQHQQQHHNMRYL